MIMKYLIVFTLLFFNSCSRYIISPKRIKLPEYGSHQMIQGTRDGCDSAHSSRGNSLYRVLFKHRMDGYLIEDSEYYDAWYRGYIYCFHIVNQSTFTSIDSDMVPAHAFFWNKGESGNPEIEWPFEQGVTKNTQGIKLPGEGDFYNILGGCKGIWQC